MHTPIATTQTATPGNGPLAVIRRILLRKLWLPKAVYEALPYIYILAGTGALIAALYLPGWTWILPYIILLGLVCLHIGLGLVTLRLRFRSSRSGPDRTN
jgi:hypothetical protein